MINTYTCIAMFLGHESYLQHMTKEDAVLIYNIDK